MSALRVPVQGEHGPGGGEASLDRERSVPQLPPVWESGPGFPPSPVAQCPPGHLQVWLTPITVPGFGPQKVLTG